MQNVTEQIHTTCPRDCYEMTYPYGWEHDIKESRLTVAKAHPGVNTNALTDDRAYDEASGTAVLFGTPVTIEPLTQCPEADISTPIDLTGRKSAQLISGRQLKVYEGASHGLMFSHMDRLTGDLLALIKG
jgi:hypothetical protein